MRAVDVLPHATVRPARAVFRFGLPALKFPFSSFQPIVLIINKSERRGIFFEN